MIKTEQELKDALEDIFFDALTDTSNPPYYTDKVDPENDGYWQCKVYELCADELIKRGYGDISEYKAEIERLKAENEALKNDLINSEGNLNHITTEFKQLQTNAEILASGVRDLNHENYELTQKLAKQTRIARDANAKCTGAERYLRPFQYKADRLETKCNDLKRLSDWQREEIKRLKAEVNKGCDNCETVKQAQIDAINTIVKYCENPNHWRELKDCKLFGGKSNDLRVFLNGIFKEVDV